MGRGSGGAALAPVDDVAADATDHRLVAKVRRGDDRAFELLYQRYHRRIHGYVLGMVKDHGRAEDVTQEVFVSALRRMRATERPIAFKPWIYEIAKNACIDAFRRSKRAEEVSYDSEDGLAPADHSRLVGSGPTPDAAVAAKQDIESLWGAFGGLSETHHEILVLRELEGLSYSEIGRRMGMSRPAVESTLFRARRRLTEEYDDIVSGARCLRIQAIIQVAAQSRPGTRDTRRLARHLSHCLPCRREALEAGLDRSLIARPPVRERIAGRVAGLLPLPAFLRLRRGADAAPPSGRGAGLAAHLPVLSDQLSGGWGKLAAGGALLIAGVGAGVGVHNVAATPDRPVASLRPAAAHTAPAGGTTKTRTAAETLPRVAATTAKPARATTRTSARRSARRPARAVMRRSSSTARPAPGGASTPARPASPTAPARSATAPVRSVAGQGKRAIPAGTPDPVKTTTDAAQKVTSGADDLVHQVTGTVGGVTGGVGSGATGPVNDVADAATGAVQQATGAVAGAVATITGG